MFKMAFGVSLHVGVFIVVIFFVGKKVQSTSLLTTVQDQGKDIPTSGTSLQHRSSGQFELFLVSPHCHVPAYKKHLDQTYIPEVTN